MKRYVLSLALVTAGILSVFAADDLPKAPVFARYQAMMNKSPFAVASAVAIPAATPNFAKDLFIANAARTADGGLVTIASTTDKNLKVYLTTKAPVEGYKIDHIDWSDRIGETKVTINKDGQTATLTFNQALLSQGVANSAPPMPIQAQPQIPQSMSAVPPVPQYNPGAPRPGIIPTLPTPPPRVRGVIQRNPNSVPEAQVEQKVDASAKDE
ncbi:MAG: hypothetical protein ABI946_06125 [Chthoniobacterales bacterium]